MPSPENNAQRVDAEERQERDKRDDEQDGPQDPFDRRGRDRGDLDQVGQHAALKFERVDLVPKPVTRGGAIFRLMPDASAVDARWISGGTGFAYLARRDGALAAS